MAVQSYRDLDVWRLGMAFARDVYEMTSEFPREEIYGLTQQVRRAGVSIASNIAEGSARRSTQEFIRFINIASGSVCEAETQLLLAADLGYAPREKIEILISKADRISKMLYALHQSLQQKAVA